MDHQVSPGMLQEECSDQPPPKVSCFENPLRGCGKSAATLMVLSITTVEWGGGAFHCVNLLLQSGEGTAQTENGHLGGICSATGQVKGRDPSSEFCSKFFFWGGGGGGRDQQVSKLKTLLWSPNNLQDGTCWNSSKLGNTMWCMYREA
uniref:Uncharacterized protein n=1 Tax=Sphaerodactylus townsendi TaxID=933632 RepID=A0ACB8FXF1_9SAUR